MNLPCARFGVDGLVLFQFCPFGWVWLAPARVRGLPEPYGTLWPQLRRALLGVGLRRLVVVPELSNKKGVFIYSILLYSQIGVHPLSVGTHTPRIESSGAREFRPRALLKPDVNLSIHPAPIAQP